MHHRKYTEYLREELDFLKLLVDRFHKHEKVTGLELDIALLKAQDIYEQLLKLKLMPAAEAENKAEAPQSAKPEEPAVEEEKPIAREKTTRAAPEKKPERPIVVEPTDIPRKEAPVSEPTEPEKKPATAPKEQPEMKEEPTPTREAKKEPEVKAKQESSKPGKEILAEKIRPADYHPINETLAQQKKTTVDVAGKWQSAPLENIASGIGLNDRFLYIRELFQGDGALYGETIKQLDAAESLDNALDFIDNHFGWNKDDETVQKFIGLVYRRHRV